MDSAMAKRTRLTLFGGGLTDLHDGRCAVADENEMNLNNLNKLGAQSIRSTT